MLEVNNVVNIPGETFDTPLGKIANKGGLARLEKKLTETHEYEVWLVYYLDNRYELSVQHLFFKNNLPKSTSTIITKEKIMATRKIQKKSSKKAVKKTAKKAAKKSVKKAVKKVSTNDKKIPVSRFICDHIVRKVPDEKIIASLQMEYKGYKGTDLKAINYYRKFINEGKMEKAGFPKPSTPYEPTGGSSKKVAVKKTASRKVASRVK